MVVEVQQYDETDRFGGDFGWSTIPGYVNCQSHGTT
jgi:hypothetical protein